MEQLVTVGVLTSVIVALAELWKRLDLNPKWVPIPNIVLGIVGSMVYLYPEDVAAAVLQGLIIGLTASGLYSSVKNVKEGIQGN